MNLPKFYKTIRSSRNFPKPTRKMKLAKQKFLWLLIANLFEFSLQASATKLIASRGEMTFDASVLNASMNLELLPKDTYSFKFEMDLLVDLETFLVRVGIVLPLANGTFDTSIKSNVADMCKYYRDKSSNMFLRLFFSGHFGKKRLPTSCPVKAGRYFIDDFQLNDDLLKYRFIETKFMLLIDLCTKAGTKLKCGVNMKFYGEVRDREKWEKEMSAKSSRK